MTQPVSRITRRRMVGLGVAAILTGGVFYGGRWYNITARNDAATLTPPQAHARALAGQLLLVDIRRPDEWKRTGVGQGAHPLDMRRDDFAAMLGQLAQANPDRPIALICARGVRSRFMVKQMQHAGFDDILDVPEGMLGSGAGPGWIKRGLPVTQL